MTDIELLELAAKAAGIEYDVQTESDRRYWNPLTDDDDALAEAASMLLNGSFLHDQSPEKLLADQAAKAIRALKRANPPSDI